MGKRFGDLEKRALAILANGGNPATSQDKALANYWTWRINPSDPSHNLPTASERPKNRKLIPAYLSPFGANLGVNILAKVSISTRSNTAGDGIKAACEVVTTLPGTSVGIRVKSFVPARVYWRTGEGETSAPRESQKKLTRASTRRRMKAIAYLLGAKAQIRC